MNVKKMMNEQRSRSGKTLYGINDRFKNLQVLIEPGNLKDFAVGSVTGGNFQIAVERPQGFVGTEQRFQPDRVDRFTAVEIDNHVAAFKRRKEAFQESRGVAAEFLGRMDDHNLAKDFSG
jgi:hypothetical protein